MEIYKIPIEFAFIVFPFVAFILTIPFLLHQYRKYGAIPFAKSLVFYSFILYLICAYFLIMLPLPSVESVAKLTTPKMQLVPFQFIKDIFATTTFKIKTFNDVLKILNQPTVYTVLFNFVLTLPFGVYLRYLYNKKWYHSLIYTFFLSIFFELTQLSGLYGVYPRPYRLFDVDDLLINSLGGLIGHLITPLFTRFLPSKEEMEEISYKKGIKVTLLRRVMALVIDVFFLSIFTLITKILTYGFNFNKYSSLIVILIYYLIIPLTTSGRTLGKKILNLKITSTEGQIKWYQILIRNFLFVSITIYPVIWINTLLENVNKDIINRLYSVILVYEVINIMYYLLPLKGKEPLFLYEKFTNTHNVSTIEREVREKEKNIESKSRKNKNEHKKEN